MTLTQLASEVRLYLANHWIAHVPSHIFRLAFYRRIMRFQIGPGSNLSMGCWFDCAQGIVIGKGTTINRQCRLDGRGGITIGNAVSLSSNVTILTADHDPHCPDFGTRLAPVTIGHHVFIGTGAIILKGVHLGDGSLVGAGSVIARDVPPGEIWAGNPAQKIGVRRIQTYTYDNTYRRLLQ